MLRAWRWASGALKNGMSKSDGRRGRVLLALNTGCSGVLMATGDCIEQELERRRLLQHGHDWLRTGRMFVCGLVQGAPQHWFYLYLDRYLPGTRLRTIGKKILIDQLIASPFCIVVFFTGMGLLENRTLDDCQKELSQKFATVYITDWCVWPPTQFINFYFLPVQYRVIYVNSMTMLYNIFLSYIKHKEVD